MASARQAGSALGIVLAVVAGCAGTCGTSWECAEPAAPAALPAKLSETGLYADVASGRLAEGVVAYRPSFELWSDGAAKRRWAKLPSGTTIDASNPDDWDFPVGTKLWKEFTKDGVRVETRLLERLGPGLGGWAMVSYVWNEAGTDAEATPAGRADARGTTHDVPAARACLGCHDARKSRVLGFSAVQLAHDAAPGEIALADLVAAGRVVPPPPPIAVPGDSGQRAALGYLHANCGHCHQRDRPPSAGGRCYEPLRPFELALRVGDLASVEATGAYRTGVGPAFRPGDPDGSRLVPLVKARGIPNQMPPIGTEAVDAAGVALLTSWIAGMK